MSTCNNHAQCQEQALQKAQMICSDYNLNLTPLRKKVLSIIWESHKPTKAYELIKAMSSTINTTKPPTAYRALEFLEANHLIHKIQSLNSYIGCTHPSIKHNCSFLICLKCKNVQEFCNNDLDSQISDNVKKHSFLSKQSILEVQGICKDCND